NLPSKNQSNNSNSYSTTSGAFGCRRIDRDHQHNVRYPLKHRRIKEGLCLYCGNSSHRLINCPLRNKKNNANVASFEKTCKLDNDRNVKGIFSLNKKSIPATILVDSGSDLNLMDFTYAKEKSIPLTFWNNESGKITGINSNSCKIIAKILPIKLTINNHKSFIEFYIIEFDKTFNCILGREFLNPQSCNRLP
ncbi:hypothetical protein BCR32DRAFT_287929, partial [Anaeromyces robustus]